MGVAQYPSIKIPLVSVIMPVYNVDKYLRKCFDSLLNQTLKEIEIIVLNDGSTDSSVSICMEYEQKDERIRYYSHENRGLGETRNRGIDLSLGEYIYFVDSDDYVDDDYIETLFIKAKTTNADIVQGESKMFFEDSGRELKEGDLSSLKTITVDPATSVDFMKDLFFTHRYKHYAWNKLYRTSFIKHNNIRFGDNRRIFAEDTWFQLQTFHYRPIISFTSGRYYYYRQRPMSIMHEPKQELLKRQGKMVDDYAAFLDNHSGSDLERQICSMIAMDVFTMEALNQIQNGGSWKKYREAIKDFRKYDTIRDSVIGFNKIKAYRLETNGFRRKYLRIISTLYELGADFGAQLFVWFVYNVKKL